MRYLARLSYDGSNFEGFERLNNNKGIQNEIERVLSHIEKKEVRIHGAGRTDAKVHALDQCIHFDLTIPITCDKLKYVMNENLNKSIHVNSIMVVDSKFHARYSVKEKTYKYYITTEKNPFLVNYASYVYHLDVEKMKEAIQLFVGSHDYHNFVSGKRDNYISTIYKTSIKQDHKMIELEFTGIGFYRYMIRNMVGALIEVGLNRKKKEDILEALEKPNIPKHFMVVGGEGLYLKEIKYE